MYVNEFINNPRTIVYIYAPNFGGIFSISLLKLPDLSIEAAFVFGAISASKTIIFFNGINNIYVGALVFCVSLLAGAAVGIFSSMLTLKFKLSPLLSSIMAIGFFHGIYQLVLRSLKLSISCYDNFFSFVSETYFLIFLAIVCSILVGLLLRSQIGFAFQFTEIILNFLSFIKSQPHTFIFWVWE